MVQRRLKTCILGGIERPVDSLGSEAHVEYCVQTQADHREECQMKCDRQNSFDGLLLKLSHSRMARSPIL